MALVRLVMIMLMIGVKSQLDAGCVVFRLVVSSGDNFASLTIHRPSTPVFFQFSVVECLMQDNRSGRPLGYVVIRQEDREYILFESKGKF
jgi:hypothetical protein